MANNNNLEWFRPMWRRALVVGFCVAWTLFEWFFSHDQYWSYITLALTGYAVWLLFITFDRKVGPPPGSNGQT